MDQFLLVILDGPFHPVSVTVHLGQQYICIQPSFLGSHLEVFECDLVIIHGQSGFVHQVSEIVEIVRVAGGCQAFHNSAEVLDLLTGIAKHRGKFSPGLIVSILSGLLIKVHRFLFLPFGHKDVGEIRHGHRVLPHGRLLKPVSLFLAVLLDTVAVTIECGKSVLC